MKRVMKGVIIISLLSFLVTFTTPLRAEAQTETCVTGSCHATLGKDKVIHPAFKDGCATCHAATQETAGKKTTHPGNMAITLTQPGAELCYMCHEPKNKKKTVHAPVMGGDCTSCHNPHASPNKAMLKDAVPQICFQCHPDSMLQQKVLHPPAAGGKCSACHDDHESDFPKRLKKSEPALCYQCHPNVEKNLKAGKTVHPPVQQSCTPCHNPHGSPNKALLREAVPALCNTCHEPKNKKKVVHAPITGGDCLSCHHPHQSANKGMLREPVPQICFQCHPDGMMKNKVMHPPVEAGDCSGCHDNHQSDFANRLVADGNTLCFTCHPDKQDNLKTKKSKHPPVEQSCVQCHSPHGSPNKAMLSAAVPALCSSCHPNETALREKALVKHGPMVDGKACMNCHDPHYSDYARLLPKSQMDLCLSCHDRPLDTERGKIVDMKTWIAANKNGHGPVKDKECTACHDPHGSDYWRILARYYPSDFYTSYTEGKYALCFSCHDKSAFAEIRTDTATGFRNGSKNLHFVHVNKAAKGRTCRACHEVHADIGIASHVKERVWFNGWSMPMNFSPSKNGGSCAPGCHGPKTYSR